MVRRMFPFSTLTQFFAVGTNQLRRAARSLTLVPEQARRVRDVALRPERGHRRVARERARSSRQPPSPCRRRSGRRGPSRRGSPASADPSCGSASRTAPSRSCSSPTQQLNQAGPEHRRRVALRVHVVGLRAGLVVVLRARDAASKNVLNAARPASAFGRSSVPIHLPFVRDRDRAAVVVDEAHRDVPVGACDVDR